MSFKKLCLLMVVPNRGMKVWRQDTLRLMYWRGRSYDRVKYTDRPKSAWQSWNYPSELFAFSRRLNENLSETTLRTIFTHRSYLDQLKAQQEELGLQTAVLDVTPNDSLVSQGHETLVSTVKPYLRYTFDRIPEDGINAITDYLLSENALVDMSNWIGCHDLILCADFPPQNETKAKTLKAIVGGIESEFGLVKAKNFIIDFVLTYLHDKDILDDVWTIPNPCQTLNVVLKNDHKPNYEPRIMFQTGVRTIESCYVVGLYVNQKLIGYGPGETLPIAEKSAALDSLQRLFDLKEWREPMKFGPAGYAINLEDYAKERAPLKHWIASKVIKESRSVASDRHSNYQETLRQ